MANILSQSTRTIFQLAFVCSPIVLVKGIAENLPGGAMPIIALTEAGNLITNVLTGIDVTDLSNVLCQYEIMSGGTLIEQEVGHYPFANQTVAANATVAQPLHISVKMKCPAKNKFGMLNKFAMLTSLQKTLSQHNASGGLYNVLTPAYIYTNCLMTPSMRDVTPPAEAGEQGQIEWQLDFEKPLLTQEDADEQCAAMSKITNGTSFGTDELSWTSPVTSLGSQYSSALSSITSAFGM